VEKILTAVAIGIAVILLVALARSAVPDTFQRLKCSEDHSESRFPEESAKP
jgi:hypothetical protein